MREDEAAIVKSVVLAAGTQVTMQETAPCDKELFGSKSQ